MDVQSEHLDLPRTVLAVWVATDCRIFATKHTHAITKCKVLTAIGHQCVAKILKSPLSRTLVKRMHEWLVPSTCGSLYY